MDESRFHAMGTVAHLVTDAVGALEPARQLLEELEARWSRFRSTSDVQRLNHAGGSTCTVAPATATLIGHACAAWNLTDGLFDITVHDDLVAAGYDRSFELLDLDPRSGAPEARRSGGRPRPAATPEDISVDRAASTVRLPPGLHIDLGGIGKGRAADLVADQLLAAGSGHHVVNLGGDLRAAGGRPDGSPWRVAVTDPHDPDRVRCVLAVRDGAIATSTSCRRRWSVCGEPKHHLIDPRTGAPSTSSLVSVTVITREALMADVLAKAALVADQDDAFRLLRRFGAAALLVTEDDEWLATPELTAFLQPDSAMVVDAERTLAPSASAAALPDERVPA
jgi:thiamine biosynthesis lipoprotein